MEAIFHVYYGIIIIFLLVLGFLTYALQNKKVDKLKLLLTNSEVNNNMLTHIEENSFISLIKIDFSGNIEYVSEALAKKLGYKKEEFTEMNIKSISNSEDFLLEEQSYEKLISGKINNIQMDKRFLDVHGNHLWYYCSYTTIKDLVTGKNNIIVCCQDIDWRKKIERSLRQSYELDEMILNSIDTQICAFDSNGDIIAINRAMENFCVKNEIDASETNGTNIFSTSIMNRDNKSIKHILDKINYIFKDKDERCTFEYCYTIDSKKHWYLLNASALGDQQGCIVSYTDITKLKVMEERYMRSEERYRTLIELLPIAIFVHDSEGIVFCNVAGLKLLGVHRLEDLQGKPLVNFVHLDCKFSFINSCFQSNKNDEANNMQYKFVNIRGELIHVEIEHTRMIYEDNLTTLLIVKDISERMNSLSLKNTVAEKSRQLQEALEYDKIKTEFFANISHELRTPINIIFSALQVLNLRLNSNYEIEDDVIKYSGMIKQNCYRLLRLVNNLIDITRLDSGFFNIQVQNYDIVNIVENITLSVAQYIETREIELIFDTETEEKILACDPDKIERIMLNLLANAVKFTPKGGKITVNLYDKVNEIEISVKDTGIGIPEDKFAIIFERFRQVDKTLSRNHEGSGIGLSLVKSLVELHNGRISVKSEYGKGSEFTISLPVGEIEEKYTKLDCNGTWNENVEKINLEFSDIYS